MSEPTVLTRGRGWVALDKPSGWLVHSAGTDAPDLGTWLRQAGMSDHQPAHRIDGGTSGVVLFATPMGMAPLAKAFSEGSIDKTYLALVFGHTRPKGRIKRALADGRRGRPLDAATRYRTLELLTRCALLEVSPETGRKHQIRRHLQGIGHAIVGDERYGQRGRPTVPKFPGRLWLHAARLVLPDQTVIEAALPPELDAHLAALRSTSASTPGSSSTPTGLQ